MTALPSIEQTEIMVNCCKMGDRLLKSAIALILSFLILCGATFPAQAANAKLEQQVLEIIRNHPEVIIESVQTYQQQQQQSRQQNRLAFLDTLNREPETIIGNSPTTGAENPQVFLIEFSDFECPFCASAHDTVAQFIDKHPQVQLVYKHFPLSPIHPQAEQAAYAAWAAGQQGKFWPYHDALFAEQDRLSESFYEQLAQDLELDLEQFQQDVAIAPSAIEKDLQLANQLGLSGTPFFVMFAPGEPQGKGESFSGAIELVEMEDILQKVSG
ncbi:thioredoxin domain-containing protein [Roseofilum sp. BLCC_M154]|uniref:Thioredoxin domain-containing protein n=1 Tax=Roseofilum acuticapitatum BLCC-M154 TaxID=3022444 RepID=A0ABT7ASB2_9CYAN|nr:thioredoxin domain-containing protein [Roseofilum acuticapitatum]MDJ1169797.1 thioredoxin domain-containing protein [Roseofilum acuticapitatum BLCC-M154]